MKWVDGLTWEEKKKRRFEWHNWFAWHPVVAGETKDGHKIRVWLETVNRKAVDVFEGVWTYRYDVKWKPLEKESAKWKSSEV